MRSSHPFFYLFKIQYYMLYTHNNTVNDSHFFAWLHWYENQRKSTLKFPQMEVGLSETIDSV
jgi:hypothetical protein